MANASNSIVTPQLAVLGAADLTTISASTTRGPIATASATATPMYGIILIPTVTADTKISKIALKGNSVTITTPNVATLIGIWVVDVTLAKAVLRKEIIVTAVTPSTTTPSYELDTLFDDLVLPIGSSMYVTSTIANPLLNVSAHGASM